MSSARPRPDNHPLLIIFLVGGISVAEIRAVKEFITINKPNFEVRTCIHSQYLYNYLILRQCLSNVDTYLLRML